MTSIRAMVSRKLPYYIFFPAVFLFLSAVYLVFAGNIDNTFRWAWSDNIGWLDFFNVTVGTSELTGYATSSAAGYGIGPVSMNCSNQASCGSTNYKVNNDGGGRLSGWAWNENIGWISFCGNASSPSTWNILTNQWACPSSPTYRVILDENNGDFFGWAWSDNIGWISFNCAAGKGYTGGGCAAGAGACSDCGSWKVKTSWTTAITTTGDLISSIYDSQITGGIAYNALRWNGSKPAYTAVWFQIASSQCPNGATDPPACAANVGWGGAKTSGSGAFVGPLGTAGEGESYWYRPEPNVWIKIDGPAATGAGCVYSGLPCHNNSRYFRYRMRLVSTKIGSTPIVDDVTLSWSP